MAAEELDRAFLGAVLDNQTAGSSWASVSFTGGGNQGRDGVLVHVSASSASSLDVNNNGTDVVGWYTISPGQTFFVPFPYGSGFYVKSATATSATFKAQEVTL